MSASSGDFDRSQLERKDREQLTVIAETLGRKPPSRAKKADIVDLILELAGVSNGAEAAEQHEAPAEAGTDAKGTADSGACLFRVGRPPKERQGCRQPRTDRRLRWIGRRQEGRRPQRSQRRRFERERCSVEVR